jgi:hypothetical protein
MKLAIFEILSLVCAKDLSKEERINLLKKHDNVVLRLLLRMNFDKNLVWLLPEGDPPYKPAKLIDGHGYLYREVPRFQQKFFANGTFYPPKEDKNSSEARRLETRRQQWFIDVLEAIMPEDAEIVLGVKNKKLPEKYKVITKKLVEEAYGPF